MGEKKHIILSFILVLSIFFLIETVDASSGCYFYNDYSNGGVPGCKRVYEWGNDQALKSKLLNKAENNPGQRYMAWCPYQGASPTIRSDYKLNTCDCPSESEFKLDPGECKTKRCNNCNNYVTLCREEPSCVDECSLGEKECRGKGDDLWKCGNFDNDECLEWGYEKDCKFTNENTYFTCEYDDSVEYTETTVGYCKDNTGSNDYCAQKTETETKTTDCGYSECSTDEYCDNNDVYSQEICFDRGCNDNNGLCFETKIEYLPVLEDDCQDSQSGEYCQGENIVYSWTDETCVEYNKNAYCELTGDTEIVEECGPDECLSYTDLDPFEFEYIEDLESCNQNGEAKCGYDQVIEDMCAGDTVVQPYCTGKDIGGYDEFDCNSLDRCYEFEVEQCFYCEDEKGNCYEKTCNITGLKYIDYACGSGVCFEAQIYFTDIDKDHKDDTYCDDCIDQDRDGICDEEDNCPLKKNPLQADTDKDGKGDFCDIDRDGDGYSEEVDCNDWNPNINPGMKEIPNNDKDDDCNIYSLDYQPNTAREIMYVDIQMQDEATIKAGEELTVSVSITNHGLKSLNDVHLSVSLPGYQERDVKLVRKIGAGDSVARLFYLELPQDLKTEYEYLRVSVSNDDYKRIIYREVRMPN